MINETDIAAFADEIDRAGKKVSDGLEKARAARPGREFTQVGLIQFLAAVERREKYIMALEAMADAAGQMAVELQRQGLESMGLHEGPAKPSEIPHPTK